jgi:hypothetical protein
LRWQKKNKKYTSLMHVESTIEKLSERRLLRTLPTTIKGHKSDDDQGLESDTGDSDSKVLADRPGRMPCQTHHLQHVHPKQTAFGPEHRGTVYLLPTSPRAKYPQWGIQLHTGLFMWLSQRIARSRRPGTRHRSVSVSLRIWQESTRPARHTSSN